MAISKIKTGSITDSAVNTDKLAPGSVGSTDLSPTAITGQTELSETAADTDFTIIYDTSAGSLKKILRSNLKQSGPTISSISPTNATDAEATATFTITGTGFTAGSNARFIDANGKITEFDTVTRDSATQITATIAASSLSANNDPYDVQVTNGEGIATVLTSQVNFNQVPTFTTASGSLGTQTINSAGSFSVNAIDPDSAGNVTFELQSGSLPPGYSITNTAADGGTAIISGTDSTTSSTTTFNFVLRAVDAASNTSSRSFSITSQAIISESFTSSGTFSVPSGITAVDVLVVAGGGSGQSIGPNPNHGYGTAGGGAGGLIFMPEYPVQACGTITVTVGLGDGPVPLGGVGPTGPGSTGQDSVFGAPGDPGFSPTSSVLTAKGGGRGAYGLSGGYPPGSYQDGYPGGSGGGANGPVVGTATQPTQPGNSGAYGFGNSGAAGSKGTPGSGGGGGGAGAAGSSRSGGAGKTYTIADGTTPVYYAGGGGGGPDGTGGQGGGGDAGGPTPGPRCGAANKGGGGAGDSAFCQGTAVGGKGIVIVRY